MKPLSDYKIREMIEIYVRLSDLLWEYERTNTKNVFNTDVVRQVKEILAEADRRDHER